MLMISFLLSFGFVHDRVPMRVGRLVLQTFHFFDDGVELRVFGRKRSGRLSHAFPVVGSQSPTGHRRASPSNPGLRCRSCP